MGVPPRCLQEITLNQLLNHKYHNASTIMFTNRPLTLIAPRQNPYNSAATNTLRMRLNRDERGLVVAEEIDKWIRTTANTCEPAVSELTGLRCLNTPLISWHSMMLCIFLPVPPKTCMSICSNRHITNVLT